MPALTFDDLTEGSSSGKPLTFEDVAPTTPDEKDPASRLNLTEKGPGGRALDLAIGLSPIGLLDMAVKAGVGAVTSLATPLGASKGTILSRVPGTPERLEELGTPKDRVEQYRKLAGMSTGDAYLSEYNRVGENMSKAYVPLTATATNISRAVGDVFNKAIQYVGDDWFENGVPFGSFQSHMGAGLPIIGAAGQTAAAAVLMLLGGPSAKGEAPKPGVKPPLDIPKTPEQAWTDFSTKYPETASRFEATGIGKVRMGDFIESDRDVFSAVGRQLDKELQLSDEQKGMTLEGKLRMKLQSIDQTVPPTEIDKAVRATLDGLKQMDDLRVNVANTRGLPNLPEQGTPTKPIIVTKQGVSITPEQAAAGDTAFVGMSMEERADALALSSIGRRRLDLEAWQRAQSAGDSGAVNKAYNTLKQNWAKDFPFRDPKKRMDALDRFVNFGGKMTWEEAASGMGKPTRELGGKKVEPMVSKTGEGPYYHPWDIPPNTLGGVGKDEGGAILRQDYNGVADDLIKAVRTFIRTGDKTAMEAADQKAIAAGRSKRMPKEVQNVVDDIHLTSWGVVNNRSARTLMEWNNAIVKAEPILKNLPAPDNVTDLITKPIREYAGNIHRDVAARVQEMKDKAAAHGDWEYSPGDRVRSNKTGRVYEITARSWDLKKDEPRYYYKFGDEKKGGDWEKGEFIAERMKGQFTKFTGPQRSGKQGGWISLEGFETPKEEPKKQPRAWPTGSADQERPSYEKVNAVFDNNRRAEEEAAKKSFSSMAARFKRGVFGHDLDLKNALEASGEYGEKARMRMVLQRSATDAAKTEMDQINARIFNDLTPGEKKNVDDLMRARRIIEIQGYKPEYRIPEGITGQEAEAWARTLRRTIGEESYAKVAAKTDAIMTEYRRLLADSLSDGIINKESFDKLIHFEYSPTEYIDLLDPIVQYNIKGQKITVRGSGIADLGRGKGMSAVRMDSQTMLAEAIARVRNRQFKNRTLNALWQLADTTPNNGIVRIQNGGKPGQHPPTGWTNFGLRMEGEQRDVMMHEDYAEQFVSNPQGMLPWVANIIRIVSGSAAIRATAVGHNPFFIAAGIPMDILHVWAAGGREYSPHMPIYLAQITKDMIDVLPDLAGKTGQFEQAMKEGLGAQFMTSYGTHIFTRDKTLAERVMPHHEKVMHVLSGFNQEADLWVRMAHRARLIKAGYDSETATALARDRLDYSQGGELIKAIDTAIPFTNVGVQALYKVSKSAGRDPAGFALKVGWVAGAVAGSVLANMISSPETWKSIPAGDKIRAVNVTFGDQLYVIDEDGNKRYFYVPLRLDQVAAPISASVVAGLELAEYGKTPSNLLTETMSQTLPLYGTSMLPPTLSAVVAATNWDTYSGKNIYRGPPVQPSEETTPNTHPLSKAVGGAMGMSPMRLEAMFGKVVSPNNMWMQMAGASLRLLMDDGDPRAKNDISERFLMDHLRPIVKMTNPLTEFLDGTDDAIAAENSQRKVQQDAVDGLVYGSQHGKNTQKDITAYISTQPKEDRERLLHRATVGYQVDTIMQRYEAGSLEGVPPRSWWKITGAAPPRARAQEWFGKWQSADGPARRSMENIASSLQQKGTGYMSDDFKRALARERQMMGTDQR